MLPRDLQEGTLMIYRGDEFKFRIVVAVLGTLPIVLTLIAVLIR